MIKAKVLRRIVATGKSSYSPTIRKSIFIDWVGMLKPVYSEEAKKRVYCFF